MKAKERERKRQQLLSARDDAAQWLGLRLGAMAATTKADQRLREFDRRNPKTGERGE